jgi:hypothetical protein
MCDRIDLIVQGESLDQLLNSVGLEVSDVTMPKLLPPEALIAQNNSGWLS